MTTAEKTAKLLLQKWSETQAEKMKLIHQIWELEETEKRLKDEIVKRKIQLPCENTIKQ